MHRAKIPYVLISSVSVTVFGGFFIIGGPSLGSEVDNDGLFSSGSHEAIIRYVKFYY